MMITVFGYGTVCSCAQDSSAWSTQFPLPKLTAFVNLSEPVEKIRQILKEEQNENSALKAWVYAVGIDTSIEPQTSGQWDTIPGKGYVWRIGIHAENALSLDLLIENYRMQPGMALYVYDRSMGNISGPFDVRNNVNGGVLPVMPLSGDMIVVEWNIPLQALPRNDFTIVSAGYGFRSMTDGGMMVSRGAANCNVDINCRTGNCWQREKRSVMRLYITTKKGERLYCTGTLINQAVDANRKKPYVLTAHHCISDPDDAAGITFVFEYEKEHCMGGVPTVPAGITGSTLLATKKQLDFTLLELHEEIPDAYRPYYAGWTASNSTPQSIAGIHHPQGDVKKIAIANRPLATGTFTDESTDLYCDKDAHWIVKRWDEGVTEKGSSGSPVFDANHRVAGLLSGGAAVCSNPVNDYYSKFSQQWNRYAPANENLKAWLNPDNKTVESIWGYDPLAPYEDRCDTLGNIGRNENKILIKSDQWGYLTGQNDRNWISFAEKFNNDTAVKIIGMEVHVAKVSNEGAKVKFAVWEGKDYPVRTLYTKEMIVTPDYYNYPLHVYFDKTLDITGNYFIGYSLEYLSNLETFAVYQSEKRQYAGLSAIYVEESDGTWKALDEYIPPIYSSLGIRAIGKFNRKPPSFQPISRDLKIIFQTDNNTAIVYFEDPTATVKLECYDTSGKQMFLNEVTRHTVMFGENIYLQVEMNISNLPPGMYLIQAFDNHKKRAGKFVKTN